MKNKIILSDTDILLCEVKGNGNFLDASYYVNGKMNLSDGVTSGTWSIEDDRFYIHWKDDNFPTDLSSNFHYAKDIECIKKALMDLEFEDIVLTGGLNE